MTQTLPYLLAMSAIASQVVESRWVPDLEKRIDFGNADPSPNSDKDTSTKASDPKTSSDDKKTSSKDPETKTSSKKADPTSSDKPTTNAAKTTAAKTTDDTTAAATPASTDAASSTDPLSASGIVGATPVVSNTASPSPTTDDNAQKSNSGTSGGTIGAIVAVVIVVVLGAVAFFVIRRRKRRNNLSNSRAANMQKQDPFTMGYGNQDPMPYQDNSYATQNNAYASNNNAYMMETTSPVAPAVAYNNTIPDNDMYNNNSGYASYDPNMGAPIAAANTGYQDNTVGYTDNTAGYTDNTGYNNHNNAAVYTDNNAGYNTDYTNTAAVTATGAAVGAAAGMVAANNNVLHQDQMQQQQQPQQQQQQQATEHTPSIGKYTVVATFVPTLSDELEIEVGDQVELIVEYDDGWCQGINVSKGHTKGVFPRHCIDQVSHAPVHTGNVPDIERTKRVSSMYIN